jgi:hypothetical protein
MQLERLEAAMKTPQHLAKAFLLMVTNNIGQLPCYMPELLASAKSCSPVASYMRIK